MQTQMYLITPLSNLHIGSGETSIGVIDNLIQRDVLTKFPNINASGLKGAIREYCKYKEFPDLRTIFGSDPKADKKGKGAFRFFDAQLLAIPVRTDKIPYLMATSIEILQEFILKVDQFNCESLDDLKARIEELITSISEVENNKPIVFDKELEGAIIEELDFKAVYKKVKEESFSALKQLIGNKLVILSNEDMCTICDNNHLPVIARNHLENGTSANLWYEQVLPRYTCLYFPLVGTTTEEITAKFDKIIKEEPVSIGANASIGYGYCKIQKLEYNETK